MNRLVPICMLLFLQMYGCQGRKDISGLVYIEGATYQMGAAEQKDARPLLQQQLPGFAIQRCEVRVDDFRRFTEATGYISLAERNGGSYVFKAGASPDSMSLPAAPWWKYTPGASWQHPGGHNTQAAGQEPVRHIAYEDACAYCEWLQMRLPSEAEWEYLAQSGGEVEANVWQGLFPVHNEGADGYVSVAPAGSFPADKNGLYDIRGNVWEWCSDYYHAGWYAFAAEADPALRRSGPARSYNPDDPYGEYHVIRGGSFLCAASYCSGYEPYTRMCSSAKLSFSHIGFRCAVSR